MATPYDRMISELNAAVEREKLQLQRDQFEQVTRPNYLEVTKPGAYGQLTGMIPTDYRGPYAGMSTIDTLMKLTDARGIFLDDPRVPPELRGKNSLGRDQVELQALTQQWNERTDQRDFNASRSDSDRLFNEAINARVGDQSNLDRQYALEIGVDPSMVVGGQVLPDYLRPHQQFARSFAQANGGRPPGYTDLVKALAEQGRVPEDYNGGQPYPGQIPAVGPGIVWDPRKGYVDTVTGNTMDNRTVGATIQQRQGQASQMTMGPDGQPTYGLRPGIGAQGLGATTNNGVRPTPEPGDPRQYTSQVQPGGPYQSGSPVGGGYQPGLPAGGATAAIGQGAPMSLDQRRLIEQGRGTDVQAGLETRQQDLQNQWTQNAQRIQEEENLRQNAIAAGNLDLARQHENNINTLETNRLTLQDRIQTGQLELDQEIQRGRLGLDTTIETGKLGLEREKFGLEQGKFGLEEGKALGRYGGQSTLDAQQVYGVDDTGRSTMGREELYGGQSFLAGGKTLAGRAQEDTTALGFANLTAGLRGPEDIVQYARVVGGTPAGIRDVVDSAMGRYRNAAYGDYGAGPAPANLNAHMASTAGAGGSAGQVASAMANLGSPDQWAIQNVQKLAPTNRVMLGALAEGQGRRLEDVDAAMQKTLGRYQGRRPTAGRIAA